MAAPEPDCGATAAPCHYSRGAGRPPATGCLGAPGKVVLTFPEEGPPAGRCFQARSAGASGVPGLGWGWGYGVLSGHPFPARALHWLGTGRGRTGRFPRHSQPHPLPQGLARPLAEGPHLPLCCLFLANTQVGRPDRCGRVGTRVSVPRIASELHSGGSSVDGN